MSLRNWLNTGSLKRKSGVVSITLKLQNFRGISVSYVVWSIEMSLTEQSVAAVGSLSTNYVSFSARVFCISVSVVIRRRVTAGL